MSLPNLLSFSRLLLAPLFAWLFLQDGTGTAALALLISLLIEVSDYLDGKIARATESVSDFGKVFDPFTDAVSRFTMFFTLLMAGIVPMWMVLVVFYRDSSIAFLRQLAANRNVVIAARQSGKLKAAIQAGAINIIVVLNLLLRLFGADADYRLSFLSGCGWWLMLAVVAIVVTSWIDYLRSHWSIIRSYNP